ncbi:MAG: dockerin type I repeat-containing protein [Oscillospiraceae bacterium]|nr:dockerin type I repeat-containing protein [Oscillospiraceae bacterium]
MMKKRLLELLTSAVCCCACVGSLPAFAIDQDFNATEFCIVSRSNLNPEKKFYDVYHYSESGSYQAHDISLVLNPDCITISGEKTSGFQYGDIFLLDQYVECATALYPPNFDFWPVSSAEYVGNCKDLFETKELTLTSKEYSYHDYGEFYGQIDNPVYFVTEKIKFDFVDEDGKEYYFINYYCHGDPEVDVNTCNVGDKILASVYKDAVILPLEVYPDTTENLPGDVDGNGTVDITDVIRMNRVYVGCQKFTPEQLKAGDIDNDGKISLSDSMLVLRYIVGLVETLEA